MDIDGAIARANQVLKAGKVRCRIKRQREKLYLQATLPPKPYSGKNKAHQQKIALGVGANYQGLEYAIAEARMVGIALDKKEFDWNVYLSEELQSIAHWSKKLEREYFRERNRTKTSEKTWRNDYEQVYRKLAERGAEINLTAFRMFIKSETEENTSSRQRYVYACRKLAIAAGLDGTQLNDLIGEYKGRTLPDILLTDKEIAEDYYKIPTPEWQWAYGVLAAYGLRNHELFFCHFDDYPLCRVMDGKTSARWAIPLYREWADDWNLREMMVPKCTGAGFADYGARVTKRFRVYRQRGYIRARPYELRHYLGIRFARCGVKAELGSKFMGHSTRVHTEIYQNFFDQSTALEQLHIIQDRGDRPQAPLPDVS